MAPKAPEGEQFDIHITGDVTGKTWDGTFRAKAVLSFREQIQMDRVKRDLLGPGPYDGVDPEAFAQASVLAEAQAHLTEAPEWWAGGLNHADFNLLEEVVKNVRRIKVEYYAALEAGAKKDQNVLRGETKK